GRRRERVLALVILEPAFELPEANHVLLRAVELERHADRRDRLDHQIDDLERRAVLQDLHALDTRPPLGPGLKREQLPEQRFLRRPDLKVFLNHSTIFVTRSRASAIRTVNASFSARSCKIGASCSASIAARTFVRASPPSNGSRSSESRRRSRINRVR